MTIGVTAINTMTGMTKMTGMITREDYNDWDD